MDTWVVRYKWKLLLPRFFYEFWQAPAQWFLRKEFVPLFAHLALHYYTEKTCLIGVALLSTGGRGGSWLCRATFPPANHTFPSAASQAPVNWG